ncbi:MAG: hypothetical protein U1F09_01675 [Steroidobacteraceae bacterium]
MSTEIASASARSGFVLGLSTGVILTSGFFMLWDHLPSQARHAAASAGATPSAQVAEAGPMASEAATSPAVSMDDAVRALRTRLATQGGPDQDWELLAQSYDFLGRPADAELARQHRVSAERDLTDAVAASIKLLPSAGAAAGSAVGVNGGTGDNRALLASAEQHRRNREFKEACAAYAAAASAGPMSADAWADYADAQATLDGRFTGDAEKSIASALALDPRHPKALWLKASLAHEQRDYRVALATWRQLLSVVPAGSSDARIVEANIAEATRLAKG